jgi:hypothetical protein
MLRKPFKILKAALGKHIMGRIQLFVQFSKLPSVSSVEDAECLRYQTKKKTDENVDQDSWPQKQRNHYPCSFKNGYVSFQSVQRT